MYTNLSNTFILIYIDIDNLVLIKLLQSESMNNHNIHTYSKYEPYFYRRDSYTYEKWVNKLNSSGWLSHVKDILTCGCLVAQCVERVR